MGIKIDTTDITTDVPVSKVEITGFATPAVVAVDANLVVPDVPAMAAAVPPPAIIAKDQVITGSKSATVESITIVPAIPAKGTAILSNKLSIYGIKYATISTKVATPKVIKAVVLPIHCQDSFRCQTSKYAAKLSANNGKNTLKPTEAASPIPKHKLIMVSGVIAIILQKNHL